jgi:hypothetical protein
MEGGKKMLRRVKNILDPRPAEPHYWCRIMLKI